MTRSADVLYRVYVTVLLLAALTGPALYAVMVSVSSPPLVVLVEHAQFPSLVVACTGLLLVAALAAGQVRGPVVLSPFMVHVTVHGPKPRRVSLHSPFRSALLLLLPLGAVLGALPPAASVRAGEGGPTTLVVGGLAGATVGILVTVAWLAGQALTPRTTTWTAVLCLLIAGGLAMWWPGPLGLTGWGLVTAAAGCLLLVVPPLLDRLSGPVLLEQAHRWHTATTAGGAGDLAAAAATYRTRPRRPRPAGAVGDTTLLPVLFLRRDLVGALRTPVRSLVAGGALFLAILMGALSTTLPDQMAWFVVGTSSLTGYVALGVWSDGFRHSVEASAAPTLYGLSDHQLLSLHALLPLAVVLTLGTTAGLLAVLVGGQPLMAALALCGALFCVAVRMFDAAKGPMPLILLTPAPTPMGDASAIPIAMWQADALLLAALVPTTIGAAVLTLGSGIPLLAYIPATAAVLLALSHRVRAT